MVECSIVKKKSYKKPPMGMDSNRVPRGLGEFFDCDYFESLPDDVEWNGMPIKEALKRFYRNEYLGDRKHDGKDFTKTKEDIKKKQNASKHAQRDVHGIIRSVHNHEGINATDYQSALTSVDGMPLPAPVFTKTFAENVRLLREVAAHERSELDAYEHTEDDLNAYLDHKYDKTISADNLTFHRYRYFATHANRQHDMEERERKVQKKK